MEFISQLSEWGYIGLFIASFLAGSILPFSSEIVLGVLLLAKYDPWGCVWAASLGNWLGGTSCYYIGRLGKTEWINKYLRIKEDKIIKTQHFLEGKGALLGFFSCSRYRRCVCRCIRAHESESMGCSGVYVHREIFALLYGRYRRKILNSMVPVPFFVIRQILNSTTNRFKCKIIKIKFIHIRPVTSRNIILRNNHRIIFYLT